MPSSEVAQALADLGAAVATSRTDRAIDAAIRAHRAGTDPLELIRSAARAGALHFDPAQGKAPTGMVALSAAANLRDVLDPGLRVLPALQAIALAASEKKAPRPARPPLVVSGEVTHLGRSFLFAARDGNLPEAEAIFLGILEERKERRMAGDMLFRAAAEDMGDGGKKLVVAVKLWQLARVLGFQEARTILRPAVQYLAAGPRDSSAYRTILAVLGKGWVDLEALASGGRPLDEAGRAQVALCLAAPDDAGCAAETLALLRDGYAATAVAEALSMEASKRILGAESHDPAARLVLALAHAARFVLTFTRTSEKLYGLFQAAIRLRSEAADLSLPGAPGGRNEEDTLHRLSDDLEARRPGEAASLTRAYLARGFAPDRLLNVLADHASRNSAIANGLPDLVIADGCAAEFMATKAPEPLMALAKAIAASPRDRTAYETWKGLVAP